jgi:hypothetical protein
MMADYGVFVEPERGVAEFLSGNNVSYKRDAVLALGERMDRLLVVDYNAHVALRERGEQLYIEPRALCAHENYSTLGALANANLSYCRVLAASRAHGWSWRRRLFYALVSPVAAPAIKAARLVRTLARRPRVALRTLPALPVIAVAYASGAAGEARGYLERGAESAEAEFLVWELATERSRDGA